ncbi:hypothetical protein Ciccas_013441, partial [Cichlidogyrus casuarinus]
MALNANFRLCCIQVPLAVFITLGKVSENSETPIKVAFVQVRDADNDGKDRVTCALLEGGKFGLREIAPSREGSDGTDYILELLQPVDREEAEFIK